ncbi:MAG: NAD-dependent epimerase/dehydratase family protein [Acidimicrobiales bacterium]
MARIFVTGGAGFIGSTYVRHLVDASDDEITVFDALTYAGRRENLDGLIDGHRVRLVVGDVADRDAVRSAIAGHDLVARRGREPRRPLAAGPRRVRPHELRRHQRRVRRGEASRRGAVPARLHR